MLKSKLLLPSFFNSMEKRIADLDHSQLGCFRELAFKQENSRGRRSDLLSLPVPNESDRYGEDFNRVAYSWLLQRLGGVTQVMSLSPSPVSNRHTHTLDFYTTSQMIARAFGLNRDLCGAIALAHDSGHAPFGHFGEKEITKLTGNNFNHEAFGVVATQEIERLDLSYEIYLGMLHHSGWNINNMAYIMRGLPWEVSIGRFADKFPFVFGDLLDLARYSDINPALLKNFQIRASGFGQTKKQQIETCVVTLVEESVENKKLSFQELPKAIAFNNLLAKLYDEVYPLFSSINQKKGRDRILADCYNLFSRSVFFEGCNPGVLLALLTDREATGLSLLLRDNKEPTISQFQRLGIIELTERIRGKTIDFTDPDLSWGLHRKQI